MIQDLFTGENHNAFYQLSIALMQRIITLSRAVLPVFLLLISGFLGSSSWRRRVVDNITSYPVSVSRRFYLGSKIPELSASSCVRLCVPHVISIVRPASAVVQ